MCSAYRNTDGRLVTVVINYATTDKDFTLHAEKKNWSMYRTSDIAGENLAPVGKAQSGRKLQIPARSIVTFVSL